MPGTKWLLRALVLIVSLILLRGAVGDPVIGSAAESVRQTAELQAVVRNGIRMERSQRWSEAVRHYEEALEQWPENKQLQYGLRRSKFHFSIHRRYTDRSFRESLLRKPLREALQLFEDVFNRIRSRYVHPVSPTSFVAHGTESLYLALGNEEFLDRHLSTAEAGRIRHMRNVLRDQYWNKPISDRGEARATVRDVCELGEAVLGLPPTVVVMEYIFGGCNALDDYSSVLTPDRLDDLYGNIEGEFVGLGIEIKAEPGEGILLVNVFPGGPAHESGLLRGEHIVAIDGADCRDMSTDEAAALLRGPSGSSVRLTVQGPPGEPLRDVTAVRRSVEIKSIPVARMLDRGAGIGYIRMIGFQATTVKELDRALQSLRRQGMRGLVWDLRGNPGGLLTAAVEVLDRFIDRGVLVSTKGRRAESNFVYRAHRSNTWGGPLVLLIDGDSASASEIVAGAVRDHARGTVVGEKTYGKWSVQDILPIDSAARPFQGNPELGLRLTTAKFYSPHGETLGEVGLQPDVLVDPPSERATYFRGPTEVDVQNDPPLQKSLEVLRGQLR